MVPLTNRSLRLLEARLALPWLRAAFTQGTRMNQTESSVAAPRGTGLGWTGLSAGCWGDDWEETGKQD